MNRFIKNSLACTLAGVTLMSCALPMADTGLFSSTIVSAATSTVYTSGNFKFTVSGSNATITSYTATSGSVTIPKTLTANSVAYNVTTIGSSAFKGKAITALYASSATYLTKIEYAAFSGCTSLATVRFPSSLQNISTEAFYGCKKISTLNIPASVKTIWHSAFSGCTGLTTVTLSGTPKLEELGALAFNNCTSLTKIYAPSEYTINNSSPYVYLPKSVRSISTECFKGCSKLQDFYVHDEYTLNMGDSVFPYTNYSFDLIPISEMEKTYTAPVNEVSDWTITDSVGNQYKCNFADQLDRSAGIVIKSVTVKNAAVSVPSTASYNGTTYNVTEIASDFLKGNATVTTVVFADSIKKIGLFVGADTPNLMSVKLPKNLESIDYASFYNVPKLKTVKYAGTSLNFVGNCVLIANGWMNNYETNHPTADAVMLGNYVLKYLGDKSTSNHSTEQSINCKTGLRTYDDYKGSYVTSQVTAIGFDAFSNSGNTYRPSHLKTIDLSDVKKIYDNAFKNCSNLVSVYYSTGAIDHMGKNLFHANTLARLKAETSNQNYILMGNVLYQWLSTSTTADLRSLTNLTFIPQTAFEGTKVTTLRLPTQTKLKMQSQCFINTKVANIYVGSSQFTYANVKNNAGGIMKAFYERNYDPLEGCKATKTYFLMPLCKEILGKIGVTYYGAPKSTLTAEQCEKIAGAIYRYCSKNFHYEYTIGGSGEYTLYSNRGQCGPQARAYAYLLNAAGVSAQIVGGPGHAWTAVKVGNKWMHADACWKSISNWFLRTTAEFAEYGGCHVYNGGGVVDDAAMIAYGFATKGAAKPVCNQSMGDMDGDGDADATDLERLRTKLNYANATIPTTYADLNGDGKFSGLDKTYLEFRLAKN